VWQMMWNAVGSSEELTQDSNDFIIGWY